MNAATRKRMNSGTDQTDVTVGNATWETPPAVFANLHETYAFDLDLCADAKKALLPVWFGPGSEFETDALTAPWHQYGEVGFCNPPYGRFIGPILEKAGDEAELGFTSVFLLPLRMTKVLQQAIFESCRVAAWLLADRRITFFENGAPRLDAKGNPMPAMFDSTVLVIRPGYYSGEGQVVDLWEVPDHVPAEFRRKAA